MNHRDDRAGDLLATDFEKGVRGSIEYENVPMKRTVVVTAIAVTAIGLHPTPVFEVCK